tara:strand:+ start:12 stop:341 length:330 start_codon:yes stop_codon:yes gene_type:complete
MSNRNSKYTFINNKRLYRNYFRDRDQKFIRQYSTPTIKYPTAEELEGITMQKHIWKQGDRFYKLALQYYGSSRYWWVIPWFNQKPLEGDYSYGDLVYVPLPLQDILALT